ncbi:hypothetical protein [Streptomyces sp. CT34]|uniref:hypothetical protein n=1 Tax=Streptomyces sp. CT34 TaxID=1553907 RepID=UPI0005BD4F4E|nr:hypothetical protein [Streptomyces sp. CT34]
MSTTPITLGHHRLRDRAERLTVPRQAHQRAEEFLAQRQDAIHRARGALQLIAETWATVQDPAARLDTPYARDILDGLTPEVRSLAQSLTTLA